MRGITVAAATALASGNFGIVQLLTISSTPTIHLNSTTSAIDHEGTTYQAGGNLGTIEPVNDTIDGTQGLKFLVSGVPTDILAIALQDSIRGDAVTLKAAIYSKSGTTVTLEDVEAVWTGNMDQMPATLEPPDADGRAVFALSPTAVHRSVTFGRPKPLRNTDVDQQKLVPGDTSRRFIVSQSQKQDVWPAASYFRQ